MNKKMKKMIGLAAFSGAAAAAGFFASRVRRYKGKHVRDGMANDEIGLPMLEEKHACAEEKPPCADEISDFSGVDARDAARNILDSARTAEISRLDEGGMKAAEDLLSAYIGFLREEAPSREQNLATLLLLLVNSEDHGQDAVFQMIEDATDAMPYEEMMSCRYYDDYQDYWLWNGDTKAVILACQKAVAYVLAECSSADGGVEWD